MSSQSAIVKKTDSNFVQPPLRDAQDRTLRIKQQAVYGSKKIDSILVSQTNGQRITYNFGGLAGSELCGCTGGSIFPFKTTPR
jgi:hypothetical protein